MEGSDGRGEGVALTGVGGGAGFNGGGEDAFDTDPVASHDGGYFLAVAVEDGGVHGVCVLAAELEDVADLDGFAEAERLAVNGVELALQDVADIGGESGGVVAAWGDVAVMIVELVGAADEVGCGPGGRDPG